MAAYIGIDYGTGAVKAAAVEAAEAEATLLCLGSNDSFVPAVVACERGAVEPRVGWSALEGAPTEMLARAFRDELAAADSCLQLGGRRLRGVAVHATLLDHVGREVRQQVPDAVGVAVSVPDSLTASRWAVPLAVQQAGWRPAAYVRESAAVLAATGIAASGGILALSLGAGPAWSTAWGDAGSFGGREPAVVAAGVSGQQLRRRLTDLLTEQIISALRRDPRMQLDEHWALQRSVERALNVLQSQPTAAIRLVVQGREFVRDVSRSDVVAVLAPVREQLENLVEQALARASTRPGSIPIVAWGELTAYLPLSEWLARFLPSRQPLHVAPLQAVAAGTARLCALTAQGDLQAMSAILGSIDAADGSRQPPPAGQHRGTPLWEGLPSGASAGQGLPAARLVLLESDGGTACLPVQPLPFRLGRHFSAEHRVDAERFPMVSNAHAVILREGGEYLIRDLDSQNGTFVNAKQVRQERLTDGDEIRLGQTGPRFRFQRATGMEL